MFVFQESFVGVQSSSARFGIEQANSFSSVLSQYLEGRRGQGMSQNLFLFLQKMLSLAGPDASPAGKGMLYSGQVAILNLQGPLNKQDNLILIDIQRQIPGLYMAPDKTAFYSSRATIAVQFNLTPEMKKEFKQRWEKGKNPLSTESEPFALRHAKIRAVSPEAMALDEALKFQEYADGPKLRQGRKTIRQLENEEKLNPPLSEAEQKYSESRATSNDLIIDMADLESKAEERKKSNQSAANAKFYPPAVQDATGTLGVRSRHLIKTEEELLAEEQRREADANASSKKRDKNAAIIDKTRVTGNLQRAGILQNTGESMTLGEVFEIAVDLLTPLKTIESFLDHAREYGLAKALDVYGAALIVDGLLTVFELKALKGAVKGLRGLGKAMEKEIDAAVLEAIPGKGRMINARRAFARFESRKKALMQDKTITKLALQDAMAGGRAFVTASDIANTAVKITCNNLGRAVYRQAISTGARGIGAYITLTKGKAALEILNSNESNYMEKMRQFLSPEDYAIIAGRELTFQQAKDIAIGYLHQEVAAFWATWFSVEFIAGKAMAGISRFRALRASKIDVATQHAKIAFKMAKEGKRLEQIASYLQKTGMSAETAAKMSSWIMNSSKALSPAIKEVGELYAGIAAFTVVNTAVMKPAANISQYEKSNQLSTKNIYSNQQAKIHLSPVDKNGNALDKPKAELVEQAKKNLEELSKLVVDGSGKVVDSSALAEDAACSGLIGSLYLNVLVPAARENELYSSVLSDISSSDDGATYDPFLGKITSYVAETFHINSGKGAIALYSKYSSPDGSRKLWVSVEQTAVSWSDFSDKELKGTLQGMPGLENFMQEWNGALSSAKTNASFAGSDAESTILRIRMGIMFKYMLRGQLKHEILQENTNHEISGGRQS